MERHANYALVGILTTALLLGGLIFAVWLGDFSFAAQHDRYRIVFKGPLRGLSQGGDVQFNGIKVGEIEKIFLSPKDGTLVLADIEVAKDVPVRQDSVASSEMQGISGVNVIQIDAGTAARPLLKDVDTSDRPIIRSKPNALSSLLEGGDQMLENATEALERVNRLLSDRNITILSASMVDLQSLTKDLAANRAMIGDAASALAKLDDAASDIESATRSVKTIADGDGRRAVADVADAATELKSAVTEARGVIRTLDAQSSSFGTTTLPAINATLLGVQNSAESLDGLIRQVRQDPLATLAKPRAKELELPK